jgi:DNA-binding transcriptional regulator YiaG
MPSDEGKKTSRIPVSALLNFIELRPFTRRWADLRLDDEGDLAELQVEILEMARTTDRMNKSNGSGATRARPQSKSRQSIGEEIADGLEELADALERGANIAAQFNCRQMRFRLNVGTYSPQKVRQTRRRIRCSQVVFAEVMGVTPNAVRSWEQGSRPPSKTACRLMDVINREPSRWIGMIANAVISK